MARKRVHYLGGHQREGGGKRGGPDQYPYNQGHGIDLNRVAAPPPTEPPPVRSDPPHRKPPPRDFYATEKELGRRQGLALARLRKKLAE